mgnify:FL=1
MQVEGALSQNGKQLEKTVKSQIKDELSSFKKLTKKVDFETCSDEEFENIKVAKQRLEDTAGIVLTMSQNQM